MLAQRRNFHRQHRQSIVKVGAKLAAVHQATQVLVGGGNDLHLHVFAQGRAD
ncbi:hypothetical protein D3C81_1579010 [compost metagenome]